MERREIKKGAMFTPVSVLKLIKRALFIPCAVLILSCVFITAKEYSVYASSDENAGKYISIEGAVASDVVLTDSPSTFTNKVELGAEILSFGSSFSSGYKRITVKEDGLLLVKKCNDSYFHIYQTGSYSSPELKSVSVMDGLTFMPITANTYYGYSYGCYFGFIPASKIFTPAYYEQNDNGKVDFYFEIANEDVEAIDIAAVKGEVSTITCCSEWFSADFYGEKNKKGAKISLPKHGTYTFMVEAQMESGDKSYFVKTINTRDYTVKKIAKVDEPYSVLMGTNVVVGKAEPKAKVYISYQGKKYTAKADKDGIYRVKLTSLKKGTSLKIWQKSEGLTSEKKTVKIKQSY